MQKHHKILIGSFSSLVVIFVIINSIFVYVLFLDFNLTKDNLEKQLSENQQNLQSQINELANLFLETQTNLASINQSVKLELNQLKASTAADFSGIIEQVITSVVTVRTDVSQGTGFILTSDGYFITNAHVLLGARQVQAITSEQDIMEVEFIGYNGDLDLALLKIPGNYNKIKLGNSNNVQIGEKVIAIGNPLGLQFSVSEGIISAKDRPGPSGIEAYLQTDAALNPGNSGGPLINTEGKVIGINNFKIGGGENLGFALESNFIEDAVNLIAEEKLNQTLI